jgi:glutamate-1-semialdehyde 2,1-aminomutase
MIGAIIQARCESIRFPNKVLSDVNGLGLTCIELLIMRLSKSKLLDSIIVATSDNKANNKLIKLLKKKKIKFFIGSEKNVLERFYKTAKKYKLDTIVRITGDSPLIDPILVDSFIDKFKYNKIDYLADSVKETYPDGMDIEVFNFNSLKSSYYAMGNDYDKEHVTPIIRKNVKYKKMYKKYTNDYSFLRLTLDEKEDLICIKKIINYFQPNIFFTLKEIIKLYHKEPKLFKANNKIKRNEGSKLSTGQKFWKRAKKSISGGNMFLSKNPEMFLPNLWPTYYNKAKGCNIWDLDNKKLVDFALMGVGTNLLGYARNEIDLEVKKAINKSNMSSLNCPEDVFLAEKLLELHPWADQAKFARTGGEANAMAIRIARTYSKKENIAVCGYHGWHDWYLAANLNKGDDLKTHLLPGLGTKGVLKKLKNTIFTFMFNDFKKLENLVKNDNIGIIIMEVSRNYLPENDFLKKVRDLATRNKVVLIFDECSSGFRETFGGIHLKHKVNPDICMFGKALGNGYAITSIIGKGKIMKKASDSFISSTFWSERIGYVAGCKTLDVMKKEKSWEYVSKLGKEIKKSWLDLGKKYDLPIEINGIDALPSFYIKSKKFLEYKTYISQEMLKKNYLCSTAVYVSTAHNKNILKDYIKKIDNVFLKIKECEDGRDIKKLLQGPVCRSQFKRLN